MTELVPIGSVRASTYNPRLVDPARLDLVELSLRKLGWLLPLYAGPDGEVVSGHQRLTVAERMGDELVPVARLAAMPLEKRKAVNIVFNRGTNDLEPSDTTATLTEAILAAGVEELAAQLPDVAEDRRYRCLTAVPAQVRGLLEANRGRLRSAAYGIRISSALVRHGAAMPVIATPDGRVVNGLGRLYLAAKRHQASIPVVTIEPEEAPLADAMLNLLSMDFDLHRRYADLLRHNSFSRSRNQRASGLRDYLGIGFVFALIGRNAAQTFDVRKPANAAAWRSRYGSSVVDFGAGHGHDAERLRAVDVHVADFEPYRQTGDTIDHALSVTGVRRFLEDVATGQPYQSIFLASVLNSVPFLEDREHLITLCAALAGPRTELHVKTLGVQSPNWREIRGARYVGNNAPIGFALSYEPGIRLGDGADLPKVQKYHTGDELASLLGARWGHVERFYEGDVIEQIATRPRRVSTADLERAIRHEFDLPYPGGERMGLVAEALAAFAARRDK